jgi:hypothetical protein
MVRPGRSIRNLTDPGLEPSWVEKNRGKKPGVTQRADLTKPSQKLGYNPLNLVFFKLKWYHFNFFDFFKLTRTTRWPGQNPESGSWTGPATRTDIKTMGGTPHSLNNKHVQRIYTLWNVATAKGSHFHKKLLCEV